MGRFTQVVEFLREKRFLTLLILWCAVNLLVPFDRKCLSSVLNLAPVFLVYGAWVLGWRGNPTLNRKGVVGVLAAWGGLFLIACIRVIAVRHSLGLGSFLAPHDLGLLFQDKFERPREMIEAPALAILSVLLFFRTRLLARSDGRWTPSLRQAAAILPLLSCVFYLSSILSSDPVLSIYLYAREGGLYIPLAQILILWAAETGSIRPILKPLCYTGLILAVAGGAVCLAAALGTREARLWMAAKPLEWIRWDSSAAADRFWRLQFPFEHHNRAASYFLLVVFTPLALFGRAPRKRLPQSSIPSPQSAIRNPQSSIRSPQSAIRNPQSAIRNPQSSIPNSQSAIRNPQLLQALALLPLFALLASKTRGAYVALAVGLAVMLLAAGNWRKLWSWGILLAGCVLLFLLPGPRNQVLSIFRSETYTRRGDTLYLRYAGWRAAVEMIRSHPVLGVGYGSEVFEEVYRRDFQNLYKDPEKKPHAHNNFLEIASESGLGALALFLWLNGLIAWRLWRRRKMPGGCYRPALLGLLAAIHAYGMANYNLRQGIGFLLWGLLALLLADSLEEKAACTSETPSAPAKSS
jgi:major type 1 subunit fimbrin (pilin)